MKSLARLLGVVLFFYAADVLLGAPPSKEQIARAIKELGDDSFEVRQKAQDFLRTAGQAAEPALLEAIKSTDFEVVRRAREVLEDFKWGIYPETPKPILDLIARYRAGDDATRRTIARELTRQGSIGFSTLLKIAQAEENVELRRYLQQETAREAALAAGGLLAEGNHAALERLLEMSLGTERDNAQRNYVALVLLRGRIDEVLPDVKARAEKADKQAAELLTFLCRAKGDLAGAQAAAEKSGNGRLINFILGERGHWKELAAHYAKGEDPSEFGTEALGYRVAFHRLAGNQPELESALKELRKFGDQQIEDSGYVWLTSKALLLNDHPQEAMARLMRGKSYQQVFEILSFQGKYKEAFEVADQAAGAEGNPFLNVQLSRARVQYTLGEKDQALVKLVVLADELQKRNETGLQQTLVRTLYRLGENARAFEECARFIAAGGEAFNPAGLLGVLFPDHGEAAAVLWKSFKQEFPGDKPEAHLKRLRDIFETRSPGKDFDAWLAKAERAAQGLQGREQTAWLQALGEACLAAGQQDKGEAYLEKAADSSETSAPRLRLADILAEKKQWKQAAEAYGKAWNVDKNQPLPLFLHGWALVQAGQEADGRKWMELSHWLPLGNEQVRYLFHNNLTQRGFKEEAKKERDLILKVGAPEGWGTTETLRQLAYDAAAQKDYMKAADLFERFRIRCLRSNTSFVEAGAYVQMPAIIHQNRARGFLAVGKIDEAKKEIDQCLALMPGNVNLLIELVTDLDRLGKKQEASNLFAQALAFQEQLCTAYPGSSYRHNTLAWLAACCRRDLDRADEHARKATELEPKNAGYLDTLAEVTFQRGKQEDAVRIMKKCVEMEPKNDYFRRQLKRMESGNRNSEVPDPGT